jgi:hypothetical protein
MSVSLNLTGTTHEILQAIFTAQMATQLLTLKALVDHGVVNGDALLDAMAKTADEMGETPASIIDFMGKNIEAHINNRNPPPFALTVIDGGKE